MHKYITLFFSVLLFLSACGDEKTPDDVLPRPQMTTVLTEVHIIDGSLYTVSQVPDSLYKYGMGKYRAAFKAHHTSSAQFKKSLEYYAKQPEELQSIYDEMLKVLKFKTDSVGKIQSKQLNQTK